MAVMKLAFLLLLFMAMTTTVKPYCDSSTPSSYDWHNDWKQSFHAWCNTSYSVSHWYTYYRYCQGDRLHHFRCTPTPVNHSHTVSCSWSNYLHNPGQYYFKACANNAYIAGVSSTYDPSTSDRKIQLKCCSVSGYHMTNCSATLYQNWFGSSLYYQVPQGYVLTGVGSYFSYYYRDRRWRFYYCKMQ